MGWIPGVELGPVISAAAQDRIVNAIVDGSRAGRSSCWTGGAPAWLGYEEGFFVGPPSSTA